MVFIVRFSKLDSLALNVIFKEKLINYILRLHFKKLKNNCL